MRKVKVMRFSRQPSPVEIMTYQEQLANVEYFGYFDRMITNYARCTHEIKSRIVMAKAAFNKKLALFTSKLALNLGKKLLKYYIWNIALHDAEMWMLWRSEIPASLKMWCWRRMEKISRTDCVRSEEVLQRVKEERNILQTI
jgi:hypothetical protein